MEQSQEIIEQKYGEHQSGSVGVSENDTPVRDALEILSGKWKLPIIIALSFGNKRFSEMAKEIPKITDRMLSKELRDLEANQLVKRTVYDSIPVMVEYSMTEYGHSLEKVIKELHRWGAQHRKRIIGK